MPRERVPYRINRRCMIRPCRRLFWGPWHFHHLFFKKMNKKRTEKKRLKSEETPRGIEPPGQANALCLPQLQHKDSPSFVFFAQQTVYFLLKCPAGLLIKKKLPVSDAQVTVVGQMQSNKQTNHFLVDYVTRFCSESIIHASRRWTGTNWLVCKYIVSYGRHYFLLPSAVVNPSQVGYLKSFFPADFQKKQNKRRWVNTELGREICTKRERPLSSQNSKVIVIVRSGPETFGSV